MTDNSIFVKGARVNNLKNIDIEIPRDKLIVITGLSGSGKSSLAFDTLYAEGQRRYVESLSAYARQFLGRMSKPECDFIKGIPPAIAIEQKVNTRNPRSTVGTSTEIYDYLRLLYARIGKTISPISGKEVKKHQTEDIIRCVSNYPEGTRFSVLTTLHIPEGRTLETQLEILLKEGYNRVEYKEKTIRIEEIEHTSNIDTSSLFLIIDRMTVSSEKNTISRLADSAETAFFEGGGECILKFYTEKGIEEHTFSKRFEADGITFEEPNDLMFSFNSPVGACPTCEGFGKVIGIDENLVIPNKALSVFDDAVMCWKGEKMSEWKKNLIRVAEASHFPIHRPYYQLTEREKELLWNGNHLFGGIHDFFKMLEENQYKIQYRVMLARYRGKTVCPDCKGGRLKPQAQYVKIGGKSISELVALPITDLKIFFDTLALDEHDSIVAKRLLTEIKNRIGFLVNVGLGYLTLNRLSSTLSGGESQRINLATSLGSSLVGSLYILDEPSIGLHSRDTTLLIKVLRELQALGNTVIVVEHDEEIIRAADYIIDIGPKAGRLGGEVVYQGDLSKLEKATKSYTVRYLTGEEKIETPAHRRKWNNYIKIEGAAHNNLKGIDVIFPLHIMTVVTGVSGSGKSSLVRDVFFKSLSRFYEEDGEQPGIFNRLSGDMHLVKHIEFVDQNPIGKSSRSNPATYLKAFDEIRKLYADQQAAKQMGFTPAYFSFNVEGGRCEECKGDGTITVEMQFMADITLTCESCHGKRFKQDILEIEYRGKNINDVLEMTINQAIEFFSEQQGSAEKKIIKRLKPLQDVGLGYIKLGQASSTLSGGENQRVKLAYFLSNEKQEPTIFVFDEPTTGLHFHDIKTLLKAFDSLIEKGHTVVIIEHNMDVIKCADYVIDMGPEGGDKGGFLVCAGTPEDIASCEKSYTGKYLKDKIGTFSK
ncbi:excinuclease ABC subunit UvrA [Coprobacter fastidiosus]|jgi:excinuclease ABC subunit A|uniref:excinuclease ABC subunit UvrA n=1 Tax=Coprobacter fastidiosus TaxID=1099853 RepID=UPI00189E0B16|nr:excinuclease ABC subunit UvrA [Coprobacter fastidiosus]